MIISAIFYGSSLIVRADYDPILGSLKVYFRNGACYEYCGVPKRILEEMKEAESVGVYFSKNIKNKFDFLKMAGANSPVPENR